MYTLCYLLVNWQKKLGVHVQTVRRWEAAGKIKSIRTLGNHKRYNFEDFYVKNNG